MVLFDISPEASRRMEKVLHELNTKQDIIGAYVFHADNGVLAKNMPDDFTDPGLTAIAETIVEIYASGLKRFQDASEVSLVYEQSIITICEIKDHVYLLVLSAANAKLSLLPMVLQPVMNELTSLLENNRREDALQPGTSGNHLSSPSDSNNPAIVSERLMASGSMANILQELQISLTKIIGPIAGIIFMDSLKEWTATDHPDLSTIPNLLDILREEINDPEKFNSYRKEIMPHVWMGG
ncbi:MAG: hypothetical protein R6X10_10605 [Desulfobacterales bacterium]